jgi:putative transposase
VQCRVLRVNVAGHHEHVARRAGRVGDARHRRHLGNDALLARGVRVGKGRAQQLMQLHGVRAKGKRRFRVTTDSKHDLPIAPNLLNREFAVAGLERHPVKSAELLFQSDGVSPYASQHFRDVPTE